MSTPGQAIRPTGMPSSPSRMPHGWQWPRCCSTDSDETDRSSETRPPLLSSKSSPAPPRMRPTFRREFTDTVIRLENNTPQDVMSDLPLLGSNCASPPVEQKHSWYRRMANVFYRPVLGHEDEGLCQRRKSKDGPPPGKFFDCCKYWKISTMILAATAIVQTVLLVVLQSRPCTLPDTRFATDFPGLPVPTKSTTRRFDFALHAKSNGTLQAVIDPSTAVFVGSPSPEIDQAWEDLIGDRYFKLLPSEVASLDEDPDVPHVSPLPVWKDAVQEEGSYGGIDMMHSLHCVNSLRKALSPEYYADHEMLLLPGESARLHLDHCLEQLRQVALCHADTTAVTLKPIITDLEDGRRILTMLGETERLHTCRDAEPILEWVREQARIRGRVT